MENLRPFLATRTATSTATTVVAAAMVAVSAVAMSVAGGMMMVAGGVRLAGIGGGAGLPPEAEGKIPHLAVVNDLNFVFVPNSIPRESRGQFLPAQRYDVGQTNAEGNPVGTTHALTVADFNGDRLKDVAVVNRQGSTFDVFLQNNATRPPYDFNGTSVTVPGRRGFHAVGAGDFDGDGWPDLFLVDPGGPVLAYRNDPQNPGRSFIPFTWSDTSGGYPHDVVVADFDQDGRMDAAVANAANNQIPLHVFYGRGDGSFDHDEVPLEPPGGNPENIISGDFNRDGLPDVAFDSTARTALANSSLVVAFNVGGTFDPEHTVALDLGKDQGTSERGYIGALTAGDFVDDDIPDFAVSLGGTDGNHFVLVQALQEPDPVQPNPNDYYTYAAVYYALLTPPEVPSLAPWDAKAADTNGDGRLDLVLASLANDRWSGVAALTGDDLGGFRYGSYAATGQGGAQTMLEIYYDDDFSGTTCADAADPAAFCDDGIPCTQDSCENRRCAHVADDSQCSGLNGDCRSGYCDSSLGCQAFAANDGAACDAGSFCNVDAVCSGGECLGSPRDCEDGFSCTQERCDERNRRCISQPQPQTCPGFGTACQRVACQPSDASADPATGCLPLEPLEDGSACNDGEYCTSFDTCHAGVCRAGEPISCAWRDSFCAEGVCDEGLDRCMPFPLNEGQACDDRDTCTVSNVCQQGECRGQAVDCDDQIACTSDSCDQTLGCLHTTDDSVCPSSTGACTPGWCDDQRGCVLETQPDGSACDDGLYCTVNDRCARGACSGEANSCRVVGWECVISQCDEGNNSCNWQGQDSACQAQGNCGDERDNDGDGHIDLDDPSCRGGLNFETGPWYACDDGLDNNGDGRTDTRDPRCSRPDADDELVAWTAGDSQPGWVSVWPPVLGNFDADPALEVAVVRWENADDQPDIRLFQGDGRMLGEYPVPLIPCDGCSTQQQLSQPFIGDLNNDGSDELLFRASASGLTPQGGQVSAARLVQLDPQRVGAERFHLVEIDPWSLSYEPSMAIGDLDRDGDQEFVAVESQLQLLVADRLPETVFFQWDPANGNVLVDAAVRWYANINLGGGYTSMPVLANLSGGPELEIAVAVTRFDPVHSDSVVFVYDHRGQEVARYTRRQPSGSGAVPMLATGDVNGDGRQDIAVAHGSDVYALTLSGGNLRKLWEYRGLYPQFAGDFGKQVDSLALGDVTGDGVPEVVVRARYSGSDTVVVALDQQGHTRWRRPLYYAQSWLPIVLADIDFDGKVEVITVPGPSFGSIGALDDDGSDYPMNFSDYPTGQETRLDQFLSPVIGPTGDPRRLGFYVSAFHFVRPEFGDETGRWALFAFDHLERQDFSRPVNWRQMAHDSQNTRRADACLTDRDCFDGSDVTQDACVNDSCRLTVVGATFRRADSDGNGRVNLTDPIFILNYLFISGPAPRCSDAADANDDSRLNLTDAVYTLNYLFLAGPPPPPPGPTDRGPDQTEDELGCDQYQ